MPAGKYRDVIVAAGIGWAVNQAMSGLKDDVFPPQSVSLDIASNDFRWGDGTKLSPETTVEFREHGGVYYLTYYWAIESVA